MLDIEKASKLQQFANHLQKTSWLDEGYFYEDIATRAINNVENSNENNDNWNPNELLPRAAFLGDIEHVELCLKAGAQASQRDAGGRNALHAAAAGGHSKIINKLLESVPPEKKSFFVDQRDFKGWTALYVAVCRQHVEAANTLLSFGANLRLDLSHNISPCRITPTHSQAIHFAAVKPNFSMIELLLKFGAKLSDQDGSNRTPLHYAVCQPHSLEFIRRLIELDSQRVFDEDDMGRTPLHCAASRGMTQICQSLISFGANIDKKDEWDLTPLDYAQLNEHEGTATALKDSGVVDEKLESSTSEDCLVNIVVRLLKERNVDQIRRAVNRLGREVILELLEKTLAIEDNGGEYVADGSRRRTPGGVFFRAIQQEVKNNNLSPEDWIYITITSKEKEKARRRKVLEKVPKHETKSSHKSKIGL